MSDRILHKLNFTRKLLLTTAAFLAFAVPITFGLLHATPSQAQPQSASANVISPKFASVLVKRNTEAEGKFFAKVMFSLEDGSFTAHGVTLQRLIGMAYSVQDSQISGPEELKTEKFNIEAKLDPETVEAFRKLKSKQYKFDDQPVAMQYKVDDQLALKALLSDRFKLVLHPETRNLPAYDLVIADGGSKLQESKTGRFIHLERGELDSQGVHMGILTEQLSQILGQTVLDKTGLTGNYAFTLRWTPDPSENARLHAAEIAAGAPAPGSPDPNGQTLATALEQQLGLKLESHAAPVQILMIDHFEFPSEN